MHHRDQPEPRRTNDRPHRVCLAAAALASLAVLATGCSVGRTGSSSATGTSASSSSGSSVVSQALEYAQCMRSHGIADFPDPNSSGQIVINVNGPDSDLTATNPKFQAAEAACESLQPTGGTTAQQEQDYTAELKYAHCMQSHDVDVPDPQAPGTGAGTQANSGSNGSNAGGNGVNPDSPQYIAANKACQHYLPAGSGPSISTSGGGS